MLSKNTSLDFIMSQSAPVFFSGVVTVVKLFLSSIPTEYWAIAMMVFLGWYLIRFWLGYKLKLIEKYKSLMTPLENLTSRNKSTSVCQVVMDTLRNKKKLRPSWVYYFDEKGKNVNTAFYDLNAELEKLISNPYRLWNKNTLSIGGKFKSLVVDNKELYKIFIEMINTENIPKDVFDYDVIKKEHNEFYSLLERSRNENAELRVLFIDEFFSPLPEPRFQKITIIY